MMPELRLVQDRAQLPALHYYLLKLHKSRGINI